MTADSSEVNQVPSFERNGSSMPVLGLGTFQMSGRECRNSVARALAEGYRHLDTASMYENEEDVGKGIEDSGVDREDIFLTTKLEIGHLGQDGVHESCDRSLKLLKTEYLDLLLIHWPEEATPLAETLAAMADLQSAGKVRQIGVSNFTVAWLDRAVSVSPSPIFCNQVEYHPYLDQTVLIRACRHHGVAIVAYSPLARGNVMSDRTLQSIGDKYGKTPAQVALRWLIQQKDVAAIPKGASPAHIRENFNIFDFELGGDDVDVLDSMPANQRLISPGFAPDWD